MKSNWNFCKEKEREPMKKGAITLFLIGTMLLTGCSFLNREYSSVQPHSATYYESEDRSILRAEGHQDLVNDILVLVTGHKEEGKIRLALTDPDMDREAAIEQAAYETQFETPVGAYAVNYITYKLDEDSGLIEINIGYRRSAEQVSGMIHTNSISALYNLLSTAAENGAEELVLQVSYFEGQTEEVARIVEQVRQEQEITAPWQVNYYPNETDVGIIEIVFAE